MMVFPLVELIRLLVSILFCFSLIFSELKNFKIPLHVPPGPRGSALLSVSCFTPHSGLPSATQVQRAIRAVFSNFQHTQYRLNNKISTKMNLAFNENTFIHIIKEYFKITCTKRDLKQNSEYLCFNTTCRKKL